MEYLLVVLVTVAAVEGFFRLPLLTALSALNGTVRKVFAVISSKTLPDEEKEKEVLGASRSIFLLTMKIAAMIAMVGILAFAVWFLLARILRIENSFLEIFSRWESLLLSAIVAAAYAHSRKPKKPHKEDYGALSRALHRIALSSPAVMQASFDLEKSLNRTDDLSLQGDHLFISGLARAGTTIMMREFHSTGYYRSLTYRDMPFIMMPGTWAKFSSLSRRHKQEEERAHGDRIKVNYDSPEAFDEVFWRCFCGKEYIGENVLRPHHPDADIIKEFRLFTSAVLNSARDEKESRYLSKNNNNILRLPAIREAFPEAMIAIPYRDPVQQSMSLMAQHEKFLARHEEDPFSLKYMNWLGHHEFGKNHKPFRFGDSHDVEIDVAVKGLEYWLSIWIDTYRHLVKNAPEGSVFVSYEKLCAQPSRVLGVLFEMQRLPKANGAGSELRQAKLKEAPNFSLTLRSTAYELYHALEERSV